MTTAFEEPWIARDEAEPPKDEMFIAWDGGPIYDMKWFDHAQKYMPYQTKWSGEFTHWRVKIKPPSGL